MNILDQILENKRAEIDRRKRAVTDDRLRAEAAGRPVAPDFRAALLSRPVGLIAEVKRRSPSAGAIREPFDPAAIARAYESAGAQAVSVLMDATYFGGGEDDFRAVRAAVRLPLLYKEFIVDPWQIWHAATLGASAALLIVGALSDLELEDFLAECGAAGLAALVEVHDEEELGRALEAGAGVIGVNNRNLKTFVTDLAVTERLAAAAPPGTLLVSESGIRNAADVARVQAAGARAILVGEHLLRKPDLETAVRELMAGS